MYSSVNFQERPGRIGREWNYVMNLPGLKKLQIWRKQAQSRYPEFVVIRFLFYCAVLCFAVPCSANCVLCGDSAHLSLCTNYFHFVHFGHIECCRFS